MLTCEDLDRFIDQLCDLTRTMDGMQRVQEATDLLAKAEVIPKQFIMQWRAAAAADLHYLEGHSLRSIAAAADRTFQGTSQWLQLYGPTHYVSLIQQGGDPVRAVLFTVDGEHTKKKIRQFRTAGRRIVPAVENVADPDSPTGVRDGTDLDALWEKLGG